MVLWLLLTVMDFAVGIVVLATQLGLLDSWRVLLSSAIYLAGKAFIFKGDFLSIIDAIAGAYIFLMIFGVRTFFAYVILGYVLYKVILAIVFWKSSFE
jgi:hypothetical protein